MAQTLAHRRRGHNGRAHAAGKKPVDSILYQVEARRQRRPEIKMHFYAKADEFPARDLGRMFEPALDIPGHAAPAK